MMQQLPSVTDDRSYSNAMVEIRSLWHAADGSREARRLDQLIELVEAYDRANPRRGRQQDVSGAGGESQVQPTDPELLLS